ncbi:MAG: ABC transporter permease subunit [Anaerolineae bacterium]|nr:ABC transporter permease subunit [Anaerolineae bacterium]
MAATTNMGVTGVQEDRNLLADIWAALGGIAKALVRNRTGFIGFLGLVFYFVLTFILPSFVQFDDEVNLDEVAGPLGSRIQLLVRSTDADTLTSFESLDGNKVGVVDQTGGPSLIKPWEDTLEVETFRWNSRREGPGILAALNALEAGEIDAMLIFSKSVREFVTDPQDPDQKAAFANLVVSNPTLGPPHLLGTDTQGRDIATHIVHGGRELILVAVGAGFLSTMIAVILGSTAAIFGGLIDQGLTAFTNLILAIPQFPLLVVLAGLLTLTSPVFLAVLIGVLSWPTLMRSVRSQVLSLRERDYVEAAVALDLGTRHIMFREILPNMISYIAVHLIFSITAAMYSQIGLVVLGLAPITNYTWGVMLYFGRSRGTMFNPEGASMALAPVIAIALFQVFMIMFARSLEELFDPRLRRSR